MQGCVGGKSLSRQIVAFSRDDEAEEIGDLSLYAALFCLVSGHAVFYIFYIRVVLGSEHPSGVGRCVCEPGDAPWTLASDLRSRRGTFTYTAEQTSGTSGDTILQYYSFVRGGGILDVLLSGNRLRRKEMVGLQWVFPESERTDLCRGAAGVRYGGNGDRLYCSAASG